MGSNKLFLAGDKRISFKYGLLLKMLVFAFLAMWAVSCGSSGSSSPETVSISGSATYEGVSAPRVTLSATGTTVNIGGATVEVIDSQGNVIGTTVSEPDGSFLVEVPPGSNYFIKVTSGNLVLTALVPDCTGDASNAHVSPESTAIVEVLAILLGLDNLGEPGTDASAALMAIEVGNTTVAIMADTNFGPLVSVLNDDVQNNYDPEGTSPSVGAAGTAGDTLADTIATNVENLDTTAPQNTTVADFIESGVADTENQEVTLSLSAIDDNGVVAYYASESSATPSDDSAGWILIEETTSYAADVLFTLSAGAGAKTVYVWFKDLAGNVSGSQSDSIELRVNTPPVAAATAPSSVELGSGDIILDGTASSDGDGDELSYAWQIIQQPGSGASLSDATLSTAYLTPDVAGSYKIRLTVDDGAATDFIDVDISVTPVSGNPPTAVAGDDVEANMNALVNLDGSGSSDPNALGLTYTWTQLSNQCPDVTGGSGALSGEAPSFTSPDVVCTLVFDLVVNNGGESSAPDRIHIYVMEEAGNGVFVDAVNGDDANAGTREAPKKTMTATGAVYMDVYVAAGTYPGYITMAQGKSYYGGFNSDWVRDTSKYTSRVESSESLVFDCGYYGSCTGSTIDGFTIVATPNPYGGVAGVTLESGSNVTVTNNVIIIEDRIAGANGAPVQESQNGNNGLPGTEGSDANCSGYTGGWGGHGQDGSGSGYAHLAYKGGDGGEGTRSDGTVFADKSPDGHDGLAHPSYPEVVVGTGGLAGAPGQKGQNGVAGPKAPNGPEGTTADQLGTFGQYYYGSTLGGRGGSGSPGGSGGGGGGGGAVLDEVERVGAGGGAGGEGGDPGQGGNGGRSGGGAIGVYAYAITNLTLENNTITVGGGGDGGNGGAGGIGGIGGAGAPGGASACEGMAGAGGDGGKGGDGGDGGKGGDGSGGPSIGIAWGGGTTFVGGTSNLATQNTITVADPALGGGTSGHSGYSAAVHEF